MTSYNPHKREEYAVIKATIDQAIKDGSQTISASYLSKQCGIRAERIGRYLFVSGHARLSHKSWSCYPSEEGRA